MPTLLITLSGPLQSWGVDDGFRVRDTRDVPSFSGVIGILAASLGIGRDQPLTRFAHLRFGVRVDRPGRRARDYQTMVRDKYKKNRNPRARGDDPRKNSVTERWYIEDAAYTVGLESDDRAELEAYAEALEHPHWQTYLGRRACPPDTPIRGHVTDLPLREALEHEPSGTPGPHELILDAAPGGVGEPVRDRPLSFDRRNRRWLLRNVVRVETREPDPAAVDAAATIDGGDADWIRVIDELKEESK